jgi:hypothetical protein
MDTIKFELPSKLWKVTKKYVTQGVRSEHLDIVNKSTKTYYFKSAALAEEYYLSFNWEYREFVAVGTDGSEEFGYELPVFMSIEQIYTIELFPDIIDL